MNKWVFKRPSSEVRRPLGSVCGNTAGLIKSIEKLKLINCIIRQNIVIQSKNTEFSPKRYSMTDTCQI